MRFRSMRSSALRFKTPLPKSPNLAVMVWHLLAPTGSGSQHPFKGVRAARPSSSCLGNKKLARPGHHAFAFPFSFAVAPF